MYSKFQISHKLLTNVVSSNVLLRSLNNDAIRESV